MRCKYRYYFDYWTLYVKILKYFLGKFKADRKKVYGKLQNKPNILVLVKQDFLDLKQGWKFFIVSTCLLLGFLFLEI